MDKLVCKQCHTIFEKSKLNLDSEGRYLCPKVSCLSSILVEIDDLFIDVVIKFWEKGVMTEYCCSGHLYEELYRAYITIYPRTYESIDEDIKTISDFINETNTEFVKVKRSNKKNTICIESEHENKMNFHKRIKIQYEFMSFLYKLVEKIKLQKTDEQNSDLRFIEMMMFNHPDFIPHPRYKR